MDTQTRRADQTDRIARRKRRAPRHVPAVIEQRERKPFIFGWGADLTNRQREAIKERIALFGGIGIAVIVLAVLGWGWYQDNVAAPAARDAANNKPIARVGTFTIRTGFFKAFEKFQQDRLNANLQQIQQQIQALSGQRKSAPQLSQLQAQQSQLQQQLGSLPQNALTGLLTSQTVLQRANVLGIRDTPRDVNNAVKRTESNAGGRLHLLQALNAAGLSLDDIRWLITADDLTSKVIKKLATQTPHVQTQVRASHILISAKKHSLAVTVYHKALGGASFAALAKKYSIDTASARNGGDLGFKPRGTYVKPFEQAIFSMKPGQTRLVQSRFGWHIVKVTARQRTHLNTTAYRNAQQQAFNNWILKQQAAIGVTRFVAPTQLPSSASSTPTIPNVQGQQVPVQPPVQPPSSIGSRHGTTGTGTTQQGKKR